MTLISSLITDAFREGNIIPLTATPNASQLTEALRLYNQNIRSVFGSDAGENLTDWPLGSYGYDDPYFNDPRSPDTIKHPTINRRLLANNTAPITVYLTDAQDGARVGIADQFSRLATFPVTLDANGRTIEGAPTKVLNTNGLFQEWFYRADTGNWMKVTSLLSTDDNPFPNDFDIFFICGLAMRLNPRFGRQMDPQTATVYKAQRIQFTARYLQSMPLQPDDSLSWPFMSRQSFNQQRGFSSSTAFNVGGYGGS